MSDPMPYKWGGDGTAGDCSGDMRKRVKQYRDGMSIAEIAASFLEDMEPVMERIEERRVNDPIEVAARLLYQCRHPDGGPIGGPFGGDVTWAELEWRDARAAAQVLADAGVLATGEEWSAAYIGVTPDGTRTVCPIGTEGSRAHAEATRDDCAKDDPGTRFFLARRRYTGWQEATE